ncbi:MAG: putative aminopeptidase FrvX [Cryomorphaceae bacterium]|jgi:putative aminopeptidase FrvX
MKEKALALLKELTDAHSVPGYEDEVRAIFADELENVGGSLGADRQGSVYFERGLGENCGPRVMIAGHMDEVGFRVQHIRPDGYLKFVPVGGWWPHTLLAQRVEVLTKSGDKILGVISSTPPHFLSEEKRNKVMSLGELFIDIGASNATEVRDEFGICLGDPIAPATSFTAMAKEGYYMAKAFDNRVGMACAIQAAQILVREEGHPNTLISAGTVQEEVGLRGARSLANKVKPDVAIILEGPPADDTPGFNPSESQGKIGGGVQIRLHDPSAIMNPRLVDLAIETAQKEGIPHQVTVRSSGGTDAGGFSMSNEGVPCVVLGVPSRYIHSHNAIINIEDYLCMVRLSVALVKRLDQEKVDELVKYL